MQIRRSLRLLNENIFKELGVSENLIIEFVPWKGYRLNAKHVKLG
jgi:hypothetical protein